MKLPANPYQEVLRTLANAGVDFIVGGGVACVLHGVERVTMDVDLAVWMQPANFGRFIETMQRLGLKPRVPLAPETLLQPEVVQQMITEKHALVFTFIDPDQPHRQVDLFLRSELSYDSLLADTEWVNLEGYRVRIINRQRLLSIKLGIQPPRTKDLIDIDFLRRNDP